jgi:hypothetical protein
MDFEKLLTIIVMGEAFAIQLFVVDVWSLSQKVVVTFGQLSLLGCWLLLDRCFFWSVARFGSCSKRGRCPFWEINNCSAKLKK